MERLKHVILYLLIALVFFFNIERLDFNRESIVNIHSFVYVLAVLAVFSTIVLPVFMRFSASQNVVFWLGIYVGLHLILFKGQALVSDIYITVTEVGMLIVLTSLSYQVANGLKEFRQAVESMAMTQLRGTSLLLDQAGDYIRKEMRRSRQYKRTLSVIVATPNFQSIKEPLPPLVQEVQKTIANHFARAKLAKMIGEEVQIVNTVLEDRENDRFIIVCPEVDQADASLLAEKVCTVIKRNLGVEVRCGTASFPDMALTFEELISQAEKLERSYVSPFFSHEHGVMVHAKD
ncbi:MAG: hypothetical protein H6667_19950 [Ardenticatenaceae bacterium]|nr:hypothetical protein [Ardenticatenaceae bacterium]MCB9443922.1 hypothetical protein [Ardenticatenaceae bacterium]